MKKLTPLFLLLLVACDDGAVTTGNELQFRSSGSPVVYTVNYPLYWMAQYLADGAALVTFPAPTDFDPAFWQPDTDTLLRYQQADLVLLNGANYARWVNTASLPDSRLLDTSAGYREQLLLEDSAAAHSHGGGTEHSDGEVAFTTWLDLQLAQRQALAVAAALQRLLPATSDAIEERLAELQQRLRALDDRLEFLGKKLGDTPLLYSHPVYQYLQQRYQLNGKALHWEPEQVPDESQWRELTDILQDHPAQLMLWEAQPLPIVADRLKTLGIRVVVFAPLGNWPAEGDFLENMAANILALDTAFN